MCAYDIHFPSEIENPGGKGKNDQNHEKKNSTNFVPCDPNVQFIVKRDPIHWL